MIDGGLDTLIVFIKNSMRLGSRRIISGITRLTKKLYELTRLFEIMPMNDNSISSRELSKWPIFSKANCRRISSSLFMRPK